MDANLQPGPVMDAFREQIRAVLRVRGFNFCDEGDGSPESNARAVADMRAAAGSVEGRDEVIAAGIEASTVDHQDQCIGVSPQPHAVVAARPSRLSGTRMQHSVLAPAPLAVCKHHPRRVHFSTATEGSKAAQACAQRGELAAQRSPTPLSAATSHPSDASRPDWLRRRCLRRQHAAAERGFLVQHRQPGSGLVGVAAVPPGAADVRAALGHRWCLPRPLPVRVRPHRGVMPPTGQTTLRRIRAASRDCRLAQAR